MGWANCGEDSKGRPIGYAHDAICDHPGCTEQIHRGLAYACGGVHGDDVDCCEGYFCYEHLVYSECANDGNGAFVCSACAAAHACVDKARITASFEIVDGCVQEIATPDYIDTTALVYALTTAELMPLDVRGVLLAVYV